MFRKEIKYYLLHPISVFFYSNLSLYGYSECFQHITVNKYKILPLVIHIILRMAKQ